MKKPRRFMMKTGIIAVAVAATAVMSVTAALAAPHNTAHAAADTAARAAAAPKGIRLNGAYDNCPNGDWCIFTGPNGTGGRLAHAGDSSSIGDFRSKDQSFANRTSGLVRFYYHPSYGGARVCLNHGQYANYAYYYAFYLPGGATSTASGQGITTFQEIASVLVGGGNCGNALPLP